VVKPLVALLALLLSDTLPAAPLVKPDRRELALGEPLSLSISGPAAALERLDTRPLSEQFLLQASTLSRSGGRAELSLTLYPRHTGRLTLPALDTPAGRTRSLPLRVTKSSTDTPRVLLRVEIDPVRPLEREATRLTIEACDDGSLLWERPVLPTHEGLDLRPQGEQQLEVSRDGMACTAHRWHWALWPTAAGRRDLALPWLKAGKFGRQLRFPPPDASIDIRPLPAWLPAEVAIGRPEVHVASLPAAWPVERPLAWRLEIGGGYGVAAMKRLLRLQLAPHPALNAYPPTVETQAAEDRNSPLTRLAVTLYLLPTQTGTLHVPDLRLPWFDPASGRMHSLRVPGSEMAVFSPMLASLQRWGMGLAVSALLALAGWRLQRAMVWRLARRRGLNTITRANTPAELASAMRGFSLHPRARPAATLGQWRAAMAREAYCDGLDELIRDVEQVCYGTGPAPEAPKLQALHRLALARPKSIRTGNNIPI
jgi:hypothetical protein